MSAPPPALCSPCPTLLLSLFTPCLSLSHPSHLPVSLLSSLFNSSQSTCLNPSSPCLSPFTPCLIPLLSLSHFFPVSLISCLYLRFFSPNLSLSSPVSIYIRPSHHLSIYSISPFLPHYLPSHCLPTSLFLHINTHLPFLSFSLYPSQNDTYSISPEIHSSSLCLYISLSPSL